MKRAKKHGSQARFLLGSLRENGGSVILKRCFCRILYVNNLKSLYIISRALHMLIIAHNLSRFLPMNAGDRR